MSEINKLSTTSTISAGDLIAIYSSPNGDARKTSITTLTAYMQSNLTFTSTSYQQEYTTQYASPVTGGTVQVTDGDDNIHLIVTPAGTLSTLTIKLPALANIIDKQEVLLNCTQIVTTLTIDKNGAGAIAGGPSTLAANGFFRLKYDDGADVWYRVG